MESILVDIIKESKILLALQEVFKDFIDVYIFLFILFFCVTFIHNNFLIKNKLLNKVITGIYYRRNQFYLALTISSLFLIVFETMELPKSNYESSFAKNCLFMVLPVIVVGVLKIFVPKEKNN